VAPYDLVQILCSRKTMKGTSHRKLKELVRDKAGYVYGDEV